MSGAVFLSYASQDAGAARRICDALRAAGVEVWFDQSELRGGDAWDEKIRKQIKECTLFVPIISANTQARAEGYFRLEWRLADQRTHLMGKSKPFVVPIAADGTNEADADVPDSFISVQWIKLSGDEVPATVVARIRTLLGETAAKTEPARPLPTTLVHPVHRGRSGRRVALAFGGVGLLAALAVWRPWNGERHATPPISEATSSSVGATHSEVKRLLASAWSEMNNIEVWRPELERADELCRQATVLETNNADAWAAWSQVDSWSIYFGFTSLAKTAERAQEKVARALALAPDGYEARLAQACFLVRGSGEAGVSKYENQAEATLRDLLRERPDDTRALLALGILLRNSGRADETRALFQKLASTPATAALGFNELGWAEFHFRDWAAAERAADLSITARPYWGNLNLKLYVALWLRSDTAAAKAMLTRIPARVLQDDRGMWLVSEVYFSCDEPDNVLRMLAGVSRPWLSSIAYTGPTALLVGDAHAAAGHGEAAELNWRSALKLVDERLAEAPQSAVLLHLKGILSAKLGLRAEAEKFLKVARQLAVGDPEALALLGPLATDQVLLGNYEDAVKSLESDVRAGDVFGRPGYLEHSRFYRPLHGYPAFEALRQRVAAGEFAMPVAGSSHERHENAEVKP